MKHITYQIGDYVLIDNNIRQVEMVTKKKVGYHMKENETVMHYARLCEVKNIPITQEILKKNGFVCTEKKGWVLSFKENGSLIAMQYDYMYLSMQKTNYISNMDIHCIFVHELQHALRLCGINKEIEL